MRITKKSGLLIGGVAVIALAGGGAAIASSDDNATDTPIQGSALDQAREAALAETGEGKVSGTEVDDEESYYEVEVTLDNGSKVDVQLDRSFNVVSSEQDNEHDG